MFKITLFLCSITLFIFSCSQPDDGALSAWPKDQEGVTGTGYYFNAELDSGRVYHAADSALPVLIDSLWALSECSLESITPQFFGSDTLFFTVSIQPGSDVNCAETGLTWDSIYRVEPFWEDLEQVFVKADLLESITIEGHKTELEDSILIRAGYNYDSTFTLSFDSTFLEDDETQHIVDTLNFKLLHWNYDTTQILQTIELIPSVCEDEINTECVAENDTIFESTSILSGDTLRAWLQKKCEGDTANYCVFDHWNRDTLGKEIEFVERYDTLWYYENILAEKLSECQLYNRWNVDEAPNANRQRTIIWREIFQMDSSREECDPSKNYYQYYNIGQDTLVTDTMWLAKLEELINE